MSSSPSEQTKERVELLPGHIKYESEESASHGATCAHQWILENDEIVRCLLCGGIRDIKEDEKHIIKTAERAGVKFLKWENRIREIEAAQKKGQKRASPTRSKRTKTPSTEVVPEGFVDTASAGESLGISPRKLRRDLRKGKHESIKINGRWFVKVESDE